jgi:hypothetical protein
LKPGQPRLFFHPCIKLANPPQKNSSSIKTIAASLGFSFCGVSKAGFLEDEAPKLEAWLKRGFHGQMQYMENHFDKRLDPTKLVSEADGGEVGGEYGISY